MVLLLAGCNKFTLDSSYHILCDTKMLEEDMELIITPNVVSFAYYIGEKEQEHYSPASYDEALSGKITSVKDRSKILSADIVGGYNAVNGTCVLSNLSKKFALFVLCDTENKIYAYREFEVGEDIPLITTSILFQPFLFTGEGDNEISEKGWIFNK